MRFLATPPVEGAFAELLVGPAAFAHPVPDSLSDDAAALLERCRSACGPVGVGWLSSVAGRGRDHRSVTAHPSELSAQLRRPHRQDAALARWRQARAVELALAGFSYDEIARELGYANRGTVWRVVHKALQERVVEGVDELRELALARLELLLKAYLPRAMAGDVAATNLVLRVIAQESRLLGLELTGKSAPAGPVSIVQSQT